MIPSARRNSQRGIRRFEAPRCQSNSQPNADAGAQPMTVGIIRVRGASCGFARRANPARRMARRLPAADRLGQFRADGRSLRSLGGGGIPAVWTQGDIVCGDRTAKMPRQGEPCISRKRTRPPWHA